jgi:ATP-dependent Lon protease
VTITAALASLYTGRRVRPDTAMTGEITLSGLVFPVGGLKEKILAAHRAGIRRIMLPSRNEADIEDLPEDVRKELQIIFVSRISEVIDAALEVLVANPPPPPIVTTSSHPEAVARQPEQTPAPLAVRQN